MKTKKKKTPKLNKAQVEENIEFLIKRINDIGEDIRKITKASERWDNAVFRTKNTETILNNYINRFFTEVRVLPEGNNPKLHGGNSGIKCENGWEAYSGSFYLEPEEKEQILIDRARDHFKHYFEDSVYHRNKKLGLFVSGGGISGKKLIEVMETGD